MFGLANLHAKLCENLDTQMSWLWGLTCKQTSFGFFCQLWQFAFHKYKVDRMKLWLRSNFCSKTRPSKKGFPKVESHLLPRLYGLTSDFCRRSRLCCWVRGYRLLRSNYHVENEPRTKSGPKLIPSLKTKLTSRRAVSSSTPIFDSSIWLVNTRLCSEFR